MFILQEESDTSFVIFPRRGIPDSGKKKDASGSAIVLAYREDHVSGQKVPCRQVRSGVVCQWCHASPLVPRSLRSKEDGEDEEEDDDSNMNVLDDNDDADADADEDDDDDDDD